MEEIYGLVASLNANPTFHVSVMEANSERDTKAIYCLAEILLTFEKVTPRSSHPLKLPPYDPKRTTHVHVLEDCVGENCAEGVPSESGQVGGHVILIGRDNAAHRSDALSSSQITLARYRYPFCCSTVKKRI